jgi:hypothetical protein
MPSKGPAYTLIMTQGSTTALTPAPAPAHWATANDAVGHICSGKGNFNNLWQLVGALCQLGMASLVEPVLDTIKIDSPAWVVQRAAVLDQAQMLPGGIINWESRAQLFADNLEALSIANPKLAMLGDFWREHQEDYALLGASDGNYQVLSKREPVIFAGFVGGLIDHRALTRFWTYRRVAYQMPRAMAFDGAGYGWVLDRVLETTDRTLHGFSCAIYVVEPDPASACILLNLHDLRPWRDRLRLFVGPQAQHEFEQALEKNSHWDLPGNFLSECISARPALDLQAATKTVANIRAQRDAALSSVIKAHYSAITLEEWANRFEAAEAGRKKLKILGMTSRYTTVLQYSMDELGEAIRSAGHEFVLCKELDDQSASVPEIQVIHDQKPDLLITISRLRHENSRLPKNVPALCWDQDNLPCMRTDATRQSLDAFSYVAGLGALQGYEQLDWPRQNSILAFLAAATHRYSNAPASAELLEKHRCTFSYTSNASGSPESLFEESRRAYEKDARLLAFFDRVAGKILSQANTGYAWDLARLTRCFDESCQHEPAQIPPAVRQAMISHLRSLTDRAFRHVALGWVVEYCQKHNATLRLYGKGWESNPRFAEYAQGFLPPGEEVRAVYQASDINLQIIETGFLHSRALDGLAAGGFFLYRLAPEARQYGKSSPHHDASGTGDRLCHLRPARREHRSTDRWRVGLRTDGHSSGPSQRALPNARYLGSCSFRGSTSSTSGRDHFRRTGAI